MALMALFLRIRSTKRPVTVKGIIMPPLGMSTGFLMFLHPSTHFPFWWANRLCGRSPFSGHPSDLDVPV